VSKVVKRSIVIAGHKTSVSLEDDFWSSLREIAKSRRMHVQDLASEIDSNRTHGNLSCAIRLYVLDHYQTLAQNVPPQASFVSDRSMGLVP
jgi:predicted DNA-binding ribbon-helix-helix protein